MSRHFEAKRVVVTGGASGIGFAIASSFARLGARITLIGRRQDKLEQAKKNLASSEVQILGADITKSTEVEAAFKQINVVDILVNNAGAALSAPFLNTEMKLWNSMLEVNLLGAVSCTQQVLPQMLKSGSGIVLNICSTASLEGFPYVSAYCAAKHALLGLTRALAVEYGTKPIAFCAICPGFVDTDLLTESVAKVSQKSGQSAEQVRAQYLKMTKDGRFTEASEVAELALKLCLEPKASLNGKIAVIDGAQISYV